MRLFPFLVTLATIYFFAPRVCFPYNNTAKITATAPANAPLVFQHCDDILHTLPPLRTTRELRAMHGAGSPN
jgi:hypothetical protein